MDVFPAALSRLLEELGRLPGVGPKTAQRLAFFLLRQERTNVERLADVLLQARDRLRTCGTCHGLSDQEQCAICRNPGRDAGLICVVEDPKDVFALERIHAYGGRYHVLHGTLSPLDGIGPDQLRIESLLARLRAGTVREVILAINPDVEGEATAIYLSRLIRPLGVKVTRLASGLPAGADLEYADEITLGRALGGRREFDAE